MFPPERVDSTSEHGVNPVPTQTDERLTARIGRWLLAWGDRPYGPVVLVIFALLEATVFPAPTEALLLALSISRPRRAWLFGGMVVFGSVVGGLIGYWFGASLFPQFGRPLLDALGLDSYLPAVEAAYRENMWTALITSGYTPIPYLLYTMMGGAFSLPVVPFILGSLVGRSLKYLPLAGLAWWMGPSVRQFLARHAAWVGALIVVMAAVMVGWSLL